VTLDREARAEAPPHWSIPAVLLASAAVVLSGLALRLAVPVPPPDDRLRETIRIFERIERDFPRRERRQASSKGLARDIATGCRMSQGVG
jgi:hypothetical protein